MANPFAALQTRLNSAQIKHLADKTLLVGGNEVTGIFNNNYVDPFNVETMATMFFCKVSDVEYVKHEDIVIDGLKVYMVRGVQPDGNGMVRLILELLQDA
jgi:hypothetical protein